MNNSATRVLTAAVGIPAVVGIVYLGGTVFAGVIALAAILAQLEFYNLQNKVGWNPSRIMGVVLGLVVILRYEISWSEPLLIGLTLIVIADVLRTGTDQIPVARLAGTLVGVIYPVWLFSYLTDIRLGLEGNLPSGQAFGTTIMLIVLVWTADSAAYYVGKAIGKRPLAPILSPNKTWEGSSASVPGALIVAIGFKVLWLSYLSWTDVVVFSLISGAWGQVGDLAESAFKRSAGVKDSASILPGHGGMLDRIDSLIVVVPLYYLYLRYFMNVL
ncbi:MAG: phosphatidate cytidylyltransferase [Rhodothermia bacterium]|nr:MAG: phosphatidate cytidylyltransferase [Rhodothermia bacterium]